jgi:NDP-sugar pyrophosphorylase family protein
MKAVLLAAGAGTRLAPLTDRVPKVLVPVAGEPLLGRQLRYLAANGVTDVALNVHHLAAEVDRFLDESEPPLRVHVFREDELRGTAGALHPMRDFLAEPFVLLYGDVVTDVDLHGLVAGARGIATLAYYPSDDVREKGLLELDADGRVVAFVEKPTDGRPSGLVNAGIHVLDPAIHRFVPEHGDFGFDVWPAVAAANEPIYGSPVGGYVLDVGTHEALAQVERDLAGGRVRW